MIIVEMTEQIATFLAESGFGIFDKTGVTGNVFINTFPDQPHEALAIYSQGGPNGSGEFNRTAIQVVIRSIPNDPRSAEAKAQQIVNLLHEYNSDVMVIGGKYVFDISAIQGGPNNIGQDSNGRFEFSQNFIIEYRK